MKDVVKISIRGVIVGSAWDEPMLSDYIERGVLTPLSRVSAAIQEAAKDGASLEIHINSVGGDVLAGNQILSEIQDFKGGKKIVVGSVAASMAANIVLLAGCRVEAHENSLLLFHSARSAIEGEPDALRDEAKLLDSINAPMIQRLKALGVPAKAVDDGFRAGRQFSLSAEEALSFGIVDRIRPGAGEVAPALSDEEVQALAAKDQRVAAYFAPVSAETDKPNGGDEDDKSGADEVEAPEAPAEGDEVEAPDPAPAPEAVPEAPAQPAPAPDPAEVVALRASLSEALAKAEKSEANARAVQSATAKKINELETKLKAATEALEALRTADEKTISELQEERRNLAADLDRERANRAALVGGVLAPDADQGIADAEAFHRALDALPDAASRVAFISAHAAQIRALAARQGKPQTH